MRYCSGPIIPSCLSPRSALLDRTEMGVDKQLASQYPYQPVALENSIGFKGVCHDERGRREYKGFAQGIVSP